MKPSILRFVSFVTIVCASYALRADEPLRWKFEDGGTLEYTLEQNAAFDVEAGAAGHVSNRMQQTMQLEWKVAEVTAEGDAKISQTVRRVQIDMELPAGPHYTYDTASKEPPMGLPSMIAPLLKALQEHPVEFTISPRGEVSDVKIPPELMTELKNAPGAEAFDLATPQGMKRTIAQIAVTLPAGDIAPKDKWEEQETVDDAATGLQTVKTVYTYQGPSVNKPSLAQIDVERTITVEPQVDSQVQTRLEQGASSGKIEFDREAGRVVSSHLEQEIKMDLLIQNKKVAGTMEQTIDVTLRK